MGGSVMRRRPFVDGRRGPITVDSGTSADDVEPPVTRVMPILALLAVLGLGTGAFGHLHRLQHEYEDAHAHRHDHHEGEGDEDAPPVHHDESNCHLHAMLRAPIMSGGWVPLLVGLGLFVAFLTMLPRGLEGRHAPTRIDCRGPPRR
jgi:hypothetical protein